MRLAQAGHDILSEIVLWAFSQRKAAVEGEKTVVMGSCEIAVNGSALPVEGWAGLFAAAGVKVDGGVAHDGCELGD